MSIQKNVQIVKDFFAAMGGSDRQGLLALCAEDIGEAQVNNAPRRPAIQRRCPHARILSFRHPGIPP
jgi:ketosteroid isomerase-like protein